MTWHARPAFWTYAVENDRGVKTRRVKVVRPVNPARPTTVNRKVVPA